MVDASSQQPSLTVLGGPMAGQRVVPDEHVANHPLGMLDDDPTRTQVMEPFSAGAAPPSEETPELEATRTQVFATPDFARQDFDAHAPGERPDAFSPAADPIADLAAAPAAPAAA